MCSLTVNPELTVLHSPCSLSAGGGSSHHHHMGSFLANFPTPVLFFIFLDNREVWKREAHGKPVFAGRAVNVVRVLGKKLSMAGTRPGGCKCRAMSISYH